MQLIISGERDDENGHLFGAELWRVPFKGWGVSDTTRAESWCRPRRFAVIDGRIVRAAGCTNDPIVLPGEIFTFEVAKPPPP